MTGRDQFARVFKDGVKPGLSAHAVKLVLKTAVRLRLENVAESARQ